jgi:hypothetical protein
MYEIDSSAPRVIIDGGPYYAVSYKTQIRVSKRQNGSAYRCFTSLNEIPHKSPIIWAQRGIWIIAALKDEVMLIHVEKWLPRTIDVEGASHCYPEIHFLTIFYADCPHVTRDVTHIAVSHVELILQIFQTEICPVE